MRGIRVETWLIVAFPLTYDVPDKSKRQFAETDREQLAETLEAALTDIYQKERT
jgi:hypothetical protein